MLMGLLNSIASVYLETAFWLLLGLLAAGFIKAWLPAQRLSRWLGEANRYAVFNATLLGAPLPLCSCGVLPAAVELRRQGASKGATTAFLISTPETGVDSVAVSYALLGPTMAVARVVAALMTALLAGFGVQLLTDNRLYQATTNGSTSQCHRAGCEQKQAVPGLFAGLRYAFTRLLDDLFAWLFIGIVLAGVILYFIPPQQLAAWGHSPWMYLVMLLVGVPMYICATASTPIAAALLIAGVSPGAVLIFMLVGPATNIAGLAVVKKELGQQVLVVYLAAIMLGGLLSALLVDAYFAMFNYRQVMASGHTHLIPYWLTLLSAVLILVFALRPAKILQYFNRKA